MISMKLKGDSFLERAVTLSYYQTVAESYFYPSLEQIMAVIGPLVRQEFVIEVSVTQRFEAYGARNTEDLEKKVAAGLHDHIIPSRFEVERVLIDKQLAYISIMHRTYHESSIQEVW